MRPVIKGLSHDLYELNTYLPEDIENFCLSFRIRIGPECSIGADNFDLSICTPKWLDESLWEPQWGKGLLIIRKYDFGVIRNLIQNYVDACEGESWHEIAMQLSSVFLWEYEGYRP
ncbi:immunity 8 family protein [Bordetella sp. 02P26C-1]|uniref:immunity 8 family protein n=1 Tax=Bordetella sp. 02P26C-1 TaxID=2683195 RepID=UPI001354792F|nr:hypothetical protein [Bordetella sp. 02P26C-1]